MFCIGCDYQLVGLSSRCPECGRSFDPNNPSTFAAESRKTRAFRLAPTIISAAFGTLSLVLGLVAFLAALHLSQSSRNDFIFIPLWQVGIFATPPCSIIAFAVGLGTMVADKAKMLAMIAAILGPVLAAMSFFLML